jgi:stress response protein YsnF
MSGPDLTGDEHEVPLHGERSVVEKETVPVERVRLDKDTVSDEVSVDEDRLGVATALETPPS